jgi:hypothetical protein
MADNTVSNFTIYDSYYQTAMVEELAQNLNVFNAASNGAIVMRNRAITGNYEYETMFDLPDTIDHRDNTSTSTQTDGYIEDSQQVGVKVNLKYKPFKMTNDAFVKKGFTSQTFSTMLGAANSRRKMEYLVGAATGILGNKLASVATLTNDISAESTNTLNADALAEALALFGDQASNIVCWVMHSKPYWNLVRAAIADKIYEEAGLVVYGGSPGTLGKPVIVTDAASYDAADSSGGYNKYWTMGLTRNALVLDQSEPDYVVADVVTGEENIATRIQGEFAVNFKMRGATWDVTNGGSNPALATLFTATNWDNIWSDVKLLPGVVVVSR